MKPRKQPDIKIYWSNKHGDSKNIPCGGDFVVNWSAHNGGKATGGLLVCMLPEIKTVYGTTLLEELDQRGYDLKTLRLSIKLKEE